MLGGADNPNGELLSYIIGADTGGGSDKNSYQGVMLALIRKAGTRLPISCDKTIIHALRLAELIIFSYNDRNETLF